MTETKSKDININLIFYLNIALFVVGLISVALFRFSAKNLISFFLGAFLVTLNLYWLKRLGTKLLQEGGFKKRLAIEWGCKVLVIFGAITIIILKSSINLLIFLFGLSILPIAIIFSCVVLFLKR